MGMRLIPAVALAIGGIVVLAELASRTILGLGQPLLYQSDPALEYISKPDQDIRRFGNRITINSYGLRDEPIAPRPPAGQSRVLVFGDSVVFGGAQTDQPDLATAVLQRRLQQRDPSQEVLNVSAGSWGPGNWKGWSATRGFLGATDVVLVISSHDAADTPTFSPLDPVEQPTHNPPGALYELLARYLTLDRLKYQLEAWGLVASARRSEPVGAPISQAPVATGKTRSNGPGSAVTGQQPQGAPRPARLVLSLDPIEQGLADLRQFLAAARTSPARVSVVQFWDRQEVAEGKPAPGHDRILALLEEIQIPVIQSNQVFAACSGTPAQSLFVDAIHPYGAMGQACLARALEMAVAKGRSQGP